MYKIIGGDQKEYGPVTADQLRQWIAEGRVNAQTLVQAEGQTGWQPLSSIPEFATLLAATPLAPSAPAIVVPTTSNAASQVRGAATGLLIVGILCAITALFGMVANATGAGRSYRGAPPELQRLLEATSGATGIIVNVLQLALAVLTIIAASKMRKLENYGLVMTATILSMIPCTSSCCCIGLPIGIWVLVVLNNADVKSAFR